jgi:hydroxypyruvate isomerase
MEGDLIARFTPHIAQIAHFHAAGTPGRHELTRGEVAYPQVLRAIRATGYAGFVGLEYFPLDERLAGLREARRMLET